MHACMHLDLPCGLAAPSRARSSTQAYVGRIFFAHLAVLVYMYALAEIAHLAALVYMYMHAQLQAHARAHARTLLQMISHAHKRGDTK